MKDNPTVNRSLPDKAMDHIDHALGRPVWPLRESYRNYFATRAGGNLWSDLSKSMYWEQFSFDGYMAYFQVTEAGRRALSDYLESHDTHHAFYVEWGGHSEIIPAATAAKAKYQYFLAVSDVMPDLTFKDFSRTAKVRRAA